MTTDGHPLEIIGDSSQHSNPCMENTSVEANFDHTGLQLSPKDKSKTIQSDEDDDHKDSAAVSSSAKLNLDIFDDEHESEADDCDLLPLPGTHDRNTSGTNEDLKLSKILAKGAAKKESRSSNRKKNRKDELMEIHSETQRIIRESRVHLPYHNPEKKSLSSVLEGIKQKREMFGLCSKKSLFDFPRSSVLSRNAKPSEKVSSPAVVSLPTVPGTSEPPEERPAICKRLNFEDQKDEDSQEYEDLMTRLKKKMQPNLAKADENPTKAAIVDLSREEIGGDPTVPSDSPNPAEKMTPSPSVAPETCADGRREDRNETLKISELVKRYVDPKVVPKLGRKPEGEDELIIDEEPTGVEKLFLRLEKELENNKKKKKQTTSVELSASSKLMVDGVESYQVKKVVYKMDDKTEVKKTTRDQLKEALRSQIMEERHGRLQERYQAYEKIGRDRGTLRLEEDYPALPDDDDDEDDSGGDSSGSESESSGEVEPEDEEEAAVERHEQANPFIDDEADVDDDDDDDDDGGAVEGDDDDDNEVEVSDGDDDEIKPIKKQAAKIIDDDDEDVDGDDADSTTKESRRHEEGGNRRQSVNLFDEDAMSCQRPEMESKVSKRPFEEVGASLGDDRSDDVSLSSVIRERQDVAMLCSSDSSTNHHPSSSTNRISAADIDDDGDDNDVSSSLATKRSRVCNTQEAPSQLSNNKMDSQEMLNSTPLPEMDPDWLLANSMATDGRSVSQVVQGLCSTPREKNEELLMFCSGSFATQKDKANVADSIPSSTDDVKSRKRKREDEDEANPDPDSDAGLTDGDSDDDDDDESDLVNQYQPMRKKGRINDEFVEKEAELSGSEEEDDEDEEAGGVDEMEEEEGDADDVGTEEELRNQVHRVHLKKVLDQDQREIRLLQEQLLEDGDLHDDYGVGRMRRFRWNNLVVAGNDNDGAADDASEDEGIKEGEDEAKWRIMRLEREKFLQKIQEKNKDEDSQDNTQTALFSGQMKLKLVSSFTHDSTTPNQNKNTLKAKSATPLMKIPNLVSRSTGPKPVGSFLARSKESLARFSDPSKAGVSTFNNSTATLVSRNSRNFVFAHLSPSKKESMVKNEIDKTSRVGTQTRKKPQVSGSEAPLPQSRILKLLNE